MFRWWKKRKEVKKMNSLKKKLQSSIEVLQTVRNETIIGERTETEPLTTNTDIDKAVSIIQLVVEEMESEISDRTRKREDMFRKYSKQDIQDKK